MVSKLATFREDGDIWDRFQAKAKLNGTNASAALQKFVRDYIDDKLDSRIDSPATVTAAPNVDFEAMVSDAVESRLEAVLSQVRGLELKLMSVTTNDLITQNLQTNLAIAQNRIDELSKKIEGEATAPANFTAALSSKIKGIALQKMMQAS